MNKAELVEEVKSLLGDDTSKAHAERALQAVLEGIKNGIQKDESVQLIGFGTFSVKSRDARTGRNPRTGEAIQIAASKVPGFKAGKALKDAVN